MAKYSRTSVPGVRAINNGKFDAIIQKGKERKYLGTFQTFAEAVAARRTAEEQYAEAAYGHIADREGFLLQHQGDMSVLKIARILQATPEEVRDMYDALLKSGRARLAGEEEEKI